jgi:hypothetical protein
VRPQHINMLRLCKNMIMGVHKILNIPDSGFLYSTGPSTVFNIYIK